MHLIMRCSTGLVLLCTLALTASCAGIGRSESAARAKKQMIGMTKEDVLACMGPAKKKDNVGETEVWQYKSTDGTRGGPSNSVKMTSTWRSGYSDRSDNYCMVSVVMKNDVVTRVNYNGPSNGAGIAAPEEQCGYAVANCVNGK